MKRLFYKSVLSKSFSGSNFKPSKKELIDNGDFSDSEVSWVPYLAGGSTFEVIDGIMSVTRTITGNTLGSATQMIPLEVGESYTLKADMLSESATILLGSNVLGSDYGSITSTTGNIIKFIATGLFVFISLVSSSATTALFDNISLTKD